MLAYNISRLIWSMGGGRHISYQNKAERRSIFESYSTGDLESKSGFRKFMRKFLQDARHPVGEHPRKTPLSDKNLDPL